MYIFDSYRPIHHNNIHTQKGVNVIDDGEFPPLDQVPDDEDFALFGAEEASEDENEDPNDMSSSKKE